VNNPALVVLNGNIGNSKRETDNVYNVVTISDYANDVKISCITIRDGYADGGDKYSKGAGITIGRNAGIIRAIHIENVNVLYNKSEEYGNGIFSDENSIVSIQNCKIDENKNLDSDVMGGGIFMLDGGMLKIINSNICNNNANAGAGIYLQSALCEIDNSQLVNNAAILHGGAVCMTGNSDLFCNHSSLTENKSGENGGAICSDAGCNCFIDSCVFKENDAKNNGGAIHNAGNNFIINFCLLINNTAFNGAGVANNGDKMIVKNCQIAYNFANMDGGGIHNNNGKVDIMFSLIANNFTNCTGSKGGGICNENGDVYVVNTTISNNKSNLYGGGIFTNSHLDVISCTIAGNETKEGAGIYAKDIPYSIRNNIISGNIGSSEIFGPISIDSSKYNIVGEEYYSVHLYPVLKFDKSLLGPLKYKEWYKASHPLLGASTENIAKTGGDMSLLSEPDTILHYDQNGNLRQFPVSLGANEENEIHGFSSF